MPHMECNTITLVSRGNHFLLLSKGIFMFFFPSGKVVFSELELLLRSSATHYTLFARFCSRKRNKYLNYVFCNFIEKLKSKKKCKKSNFVIFACTFCCKKWNKYINENWSSFYIIFKENHFLLLSFSSR